MTDPFNDDPALDRLEQLLRASGPPPEPSAELRARLLEIPRLDARPSPSARRTWRDAWTSIAAWRVASAARALAAIVLVVIVATNGGSGSVSGSQVALASAPEYHASGNAVAMVSGDVRRIRVQMSGIPAVSDDAVYELWIARDKKHRISLGVFRPDARGRIDVTVAVPKLGPAWQGVWLTHEQANGTPGWSHDWVLVRSRSGADCTWLIDATRSAAPSASSSTVWANRSCATVEKRASSASAPGHAP
jgi:anti-sigma-K factor RskA